MLTYQSSVPGSTTSHDDDPFSLQHLTAIVNERRQCDVVALYVDASSHTVGETLWLFEDFLQHEVRIATFLNLSKVNVYGLHCQVLLFTQDVDDFQFFTQSDERDVAIFQIDHLVGILNNRTGITAQEELSVTDVHYQRTLLTGSNNLAGVALVDDGNGVGTYHLIEGHLHSLQQRQLLLDHHVFHQLHQHLGVCVALKGHTLVYQLLLDVGIVFDDAVMNDGQIVRL